MCFQRALSEKITMRTFSPKMSEASDKVHIFAVNFVLPHIENFFTLHCLAVTVCALSPWLKLEFLCNWMITSSCARLGTVLHIRNLKKHNLISIQTLTHCLFLLYFLFLIQLVVTKVINQKQLYWLISMQLYLFWVKSDLDTKALSKFR